MKRLNKRKKTDRCAEGQTDRKTDGQMDIQKSKERKEIEKLLQF
jgi:hypothetical protein